MSWLIQRCWERLKWLVETAGIEPAASEGASLGLGPELALELLRGLLRDAEQLCDDALANAVTVYQHQFSLVLAQQGGPLSELGAAASSSGDGTSAKEPASSLGPRPDKRPATSTDETHLGHSGSGRQRTAPPPMTTTRHHIEDLDVDGVGRFDTPRCCRRRRGC